MGAAFITRRGGGGNVSPRLEKMSGSSDGIYKEWNNLAVSTNTYFLQAETVYSDDTSNISGWLEAIIKDGKLEVMGGSTVDFGVNITETSIRVTKYYSNTYLSGSHTNLYRFC